MTLAQGQSAIATGDRDRGGTCAVVAGQPRTSTSSNSRWRGESTYSARVGLRQLTWQGGLLELNGKRLRLHGASVQEDAPGHGDALTPGDEDRIVAELKAIGANAVRSQHPLDPALLERFDAAGMLRLAGAGPGRRRGQLVLLDTLAAGLCRAAGTGRRDGAP